MILHASNTKGKDADGENLELIPTRYFLNGALAIQARYPGDPSGEIYATVSVNLSDYGLQSGKNAIFVPRDEQSILEHADGTFGDEVPYGPFDATARIFTFNEDMEKIADENNRLLDQNERDVKEKIMESITEENSKPVRPISFS
jgi:hypothetical protein